MTPPGEKRVLLTRQTVQIKEKEMILQRKKKRKKETRKNSQIGEEKKRRYEIIIIIIIILYLGSFRKCQALDKLIGCEDDFLCLV